MENSASSVVQVFVGEWSPEYEALSIKATKQTTSSEIVECIIDRLGLVDINIKNILAGYELAEVVVQYDKNIGNLGEQECKERRLGPSECPVALMLLWPKSITQQQEHYRFYLRKKQTDYLWSNSRFPMDPQLLKDYFNRFLYQPRDKEYPDLCQLPDLNEQTLLDNLRARFLAGNIYTYVGSILIALNPFKFYPIYNPKYVKLYQNRRLGTDIPPHIFAIADSAYHSMLKEKKNQCIVISGESGSGKTESTNFLLHHLTALSQKGSHGSGVEQTILSAGPVLEAFGNAKTAHNNNSSRFGKFIQVNYKENGMVHGAVVQKYLLEKSRIVSQGKNERNYHVFYYLLAGANEQEKQLLHLKNYDSYNYLNKSGCYGLENIDEKHEFSRLKQSMEMVGFTPEKQRRLFAVLSAVLLLGNVEFQPRKSYHHHDEAVGVKNPDVVALISELLRVKQETLLAALTAKRARVSGETLVINYRLPEAIAARDAMAKCLYGALFDWIVLQVNHALLSKKDTLKDHQGNSIGVLDIFGFEDFKTCNSFEQLCINYANEQLQHYFNQHVFQYEQREYRKQGIKWTDIGYSDNSGCLNLIEGKPNGLLCLLDDQCNFPGATNETLLQKFNSVHKDNQFYETPQRREAAFVVRHYAGAVKYQASNMREKNLDLMRPDGVVGVLKNSSLAFVRELVGADPVAVFRWAILRAFFRAHFAFQEAGRAHRHGRADGNKNSVQNRYRTPNESLVRKNKSFRPRERGKKSLKNLQTVKTLAGRTQSYGTGGPGKARKQPMTVSAQFQHSLHSLMDTLNQANPFFIRCIKSNSKKNPNEFDEETVQRQLRYTGMLETVRIRQAGFNVRLTYEEFIQLYRMLLPNGLISSQSDVRDFLLTLNLNKDNYQLGKTKVFLRESEKLKLDIELHQQIITSITTIQKWFRACLERRKFLRIKNAVVTIQSFCRMIIAQKIAHNIRTKIDAAINIQAAWRCYRQYTWFKKFKLCIINFQSYVRGNNARKKYCELKKSKKDKIFRTDIKLEGSLLDDNKLLSEINKISSSLSTRKSESNINDLSYLKQQQQKSSSSLSTITTSTNKRTINSTKNIDNFNNQDDCSSSSSKSYESQLSVDSNESNFSHDNLNLKPIPSARTKRNDQASLSSATSSSSSTINLNTTSRTSLMSKRTDSSSTGYSDGETDGDTTNVLCTPPSSVFNTSTLSSFSPRDIKYQQKTGYLSSSSSSQSPNSDIWRKKIDYNYTDKPIATPPPTTTSSSTINSIQKPLVTRSPNISQYRHLTETLLEQARLERLNEASNLNIHDECGISGGGGSRLNKSDAFIYHEQPRHHHQQQFQQPRRLSDNSGDRLLDNTSSSSSSSSPSKILRESNEFNYLKRQNSEGDTSLKLDGLLLDKIRDDDLQTKEKTEPDVPVRSVRRNRLGREYICRSMGENMIEQTQNEARNILLRTINEGEQNILKIPSRTVTDWPSKNEGSYKPQQQQQQQQQKLQLQIGGGIGTGGKRIKTITTTTAMTTTPIGLDLKRRNSDPATKSTSVVNIIDNNIIINDNKRNNCDAVTPIDLKPAIGLGVLRWNSNNAFTLAGHHFRKLVRSSKDDVCICCHEKMDAFAAQGYKCNDCKQSYHVKCIQNNGLSKMTCPSTNIQNNRRKNRNKNRIVYDAIKQTVTSKFSLTGTSAFSDRTDKIISDAQELAFMQDFITKKIFTIEQQEEGKQPSEVDRVFKQALRKFKDDLVITYSVAIQQGVDGGNLKYTDLITNFLRVMETVCKQENTREDFPVTMGVNAFRGFMNEFMSLVKTEIPKQSKNKRKKEKKRKQEEPTKHGNHMFQLTIINIPTACEVCSSFFLWPIERGLVCQNCKLTCHKKCYNGAPLDCGKDGTINDINCRKVFGIPLHKLVFCDMKIPLVVNRLMETIEMHGLYTEGLYRKSGVSSKVRELKIKIDEYDLDKIDFSDYQVHVLAAVLKSFFRDMPEPLLTFELYDDFLHAGNLTNEHDRVSTLFAILKKLPKPNFDLMERLILHLARVALQEVANRMSSSALAIVFAPCILRTNRTLPAQDSLQDVGRQTKCIETIIQEKLRFLCITLEDISTLDTACQAATNRLSSLRSSKIFSPEELSVTSTSNINTRHIGGDRDCDRSGGDEEEALLVGQIQTIQKQKTLLTSTLPSLTRASSDDDLLLSATDLDDGSLDDLLPPSTETVLRKKIINRQNSADNSFPTIINEDLVMV
ncbi:unconventional myosin-IXAa-like isoform X2 [Aphidius gifuensis]|uniref:unconventional myosin-IXAa-like isoform X2 n=1 Tax=Aphidius gifuensis TaxID=684658 RepID=UPI001CDC764B|nr:unconventional myosin-IXAa-like isoform X2 [Aphidius gifuensis]